MTIEQNAQTEGTVHMERRCIKFYAALKLAGTASICEQVVRVNNGTGRDMVLDEKSDAVGAVSERGEFKRLTDDDWPQKLKGSLICFLEHHLPGRHKIELFLKGERRGSKCSGPLKNRTEVAEDIPEKTKVFSPSGDEVSNSGPLTADFLREVEEIQLKPWQLAGSRMSICEFSKSEEQQSYEAGEAKVPPRVWVACPEQRTRKKPTKGTVTYTGQRKISRLLSGGGKRI